MKNCLTRLVLTLAILSGITLCNCACGEEPVNQIPVISSLSGDLASVAPGDSSTITCVASDPDGDRLTYNWSTTGGSLSGTGTVVSWTAPDVAGTYSISVAVADGKGGAADESYMITVVAKGTNRPPTITSLSVKPRVVEPQKPATVTCVATDPDGDELTYSWWTNLGRIEGTGSVVTWVAPLYVGEYVIDVTVRDNKGGVDVKDYKVTVAVNELPKITRVSAEPETVITDLGTTISCKAEDPDGDQLTYTWSAPEGTISGTGKVITWTAPGRAGYVAIEITVDDGRGGTDTSSVTVQVVGIKITRTLKPLSNESGSVRSDGHVVSQWTVGDDTINNGLRNYLSFDTSQLARVEEFRSAVLSISTLDKNGTPWADLGSLCIGEVSYGARPLRSADYDSLGTRLERFDTAPVTEIDVTQLISRVLDDGGSRFQIVLYFQTETDEDNSSDNIKVSSAELTAYYVERTE